MKLIDRYKQTWINRKELAEIDRYIYIYIYIYIERERER